MQIELEMMNILIHEMKYADARKLGDKYPENLDFKSEIMRSFIEEGSLDTAEKIGQKYPDDPRFQTQMLRIYKKENRWKEVFALGNRFPNTRMIQTQIISSLNMKRKTNQSKAICRRKEFCEHPIIQAQLMSILMNERKYEAAKEIGKRFPNSHSVQTRMIRILIHEKKYEEAERVAKKFLWYSKIREQLGDLLISQGKIDELKEIGDMFPKDKKLQDRINNIIREDNKRNARITIEIAIRNFLARIEEEPRSERIKEYVKWIQDPFIGVVLKAFILEVNNSKKKVDNSVRKGLVKEINKLYYDSETMQKKIKSLRTRAMGSYPLVDKGFYVSLLRDIYKIDYWKDQLNWIGEQENEAPAVQPKADDKTNKFGIATDVRKQRDEHKKDEKAPKTPQEPSSKKESQVVEVKPEPKVKTKVDEVAELLKDIEKGKCEGIIARLKDKSYMETIIVLAALYDKQRNQEAKGKFLLKLKEDRDKSKENKEWLKTDDAEIQRLIIKRYEDGTKYSPKFYNNLLNRHRGIMQDSLEDR